VGTLWIMTNLNENMMAEMTEMTDQNLRGYELLHDPRFNKGTAFTEAERRAYRLEGLLPAGVTTMEWQIVRRHAELASLEASLHVAERVATYIFDNDLARASRPRDIGAFVRERSYRPVYSE
jgi:hypothetical protein